MAKSKHALAVDGIQRQLRPHLKALGYRARGRCFNRVAEDGLTQVVKLWMEPSPPPGTVELPGLREDLHGLFRVELGVYVPEVARHTHGEAGAWVQELDCNLRVGLGEEHGGELLRWPAAEDAAVVDDLWLQLREHGLPWLARLDTRAKIVAACPGGAGGRIGSASSDPRMIAAILCARTSDPAGARELFQSMVDEATASSARRAQSLLRLARRLGVDGVRGAGELD